MAKFQKFDPREHIHGLAVAAAQIREELIREGKMHCKRNTGTERAWFHTREEAERFAQNPANHPVYLGDVAHLCQKCNFWHLSRPAWLFSEWNTLEKNA